jgi:hypothetical protein
MGDGIGGHREQGFWSARPGKQSRVTKHNGNYENTDGSNETGEQEHDPKALLGIYLEDHWAAAGAGTSLAKRLAKNNEGTQWYPELRRIADEVEQEQQTLSRLRETCGRGGFSVKRLLAQTAERVGRLKLNGSLIGYSPLSRVLELEGLISGVKARRMLWRSLRQTEVARNVDLDQLERRAKEQVDALVAIHKEATAVAFGVRRASMSV